MPRKKITGGLYNFSGRYSSPLENWSNRSSQWNYKFEYSSRSSRPKIGGYELMVTAALSWYHTRGSHNEPQALPVVREKNTMAEVNKNDGLRP